MSLKELQPGVPGLPPEGFTSAHPHEVLLQIPSPDGVTLESGLLRVHVGSALYEELRTQLGADPNSANRLLSFEIGTKVTLQGTEYILHGFADTPMTYQDLSASRILYSA